MHPIRCVLGLELPLRRARTALPVGNRGWSPVGIRFGSTSLDPRTVSAAKLLDRSSLDSYSRADAGSIDVLDLLHWGLAALGVSVVA